MALVQYYDNFVIVVGNSWGSGICSYQYSIRPHEVDEVLKAVDEGTVPQWVKRKAGDFETIIDYHLECQYITIDFKDDKFQYLLEKEPI